MSCRPRIAGIADHSTTSWSAHGGTLTTRERAKRAPLQIKLEEWNSSGHVTKLSKCGKDFNLLKVALVEYDGHDAWSLNTVQGLCGVVRPHRRDPGPFHLKLKVDDFRRSSPSCRTLRVPRSYLDLRIPNY